MADTVFEGMWEEIIQHGCEFAGRRVRITILDDARAPGSPNKAMLDVMRMLIENDPQRRMTSGEDTAALIRAARSGAMYGDQPDEEPKAV